jgi:hypothetical protein
MRDPKTPSSEAEVTRETLLEEARQFAIEKGNPGAVVSAIVAKARVTGNIIDRREVGPAGAFDGMTDEETCCGGCAAGARTGHCRFATGQGRRQEVALGERRRPDERPCTRWPR